MRRVQAIAAAVVVIGGAAGAVTLLVSHHNPGSASQRGSSSQVVSVTTGFKATANVSPPVSASKCTKPTAFTYSGTLSAAGRGVVKYRWVYSSAKPGPVQTVRFTGAGRKVVTGATVRSRAAGGGWGEIQMISPAGHASDKATYKLLCGGSRVDGIRATAVVQQQAKNAGCATASPALTVTGSIRTAKAETVTYYWAQSDGANSAPATLTFTRPGNHAVSPLTIRPPAGSGSGDAVLVVTSPVTTASSPATYTLTCSSAPTPGASSAPAGHSPRPGASPPAYRRPPPPPSMSITVDAPATANFGQPYSGTLTVTGGDSRYTWSTVSGLPPGLTATAHGATLTISGTPNVLGLWTASGNASDGEPIPQTAGWFLNINVIYPPITITVNAPGAATVGQPYSGTLTATGGDGTAFKWSVTGLPQGVTGTANGATFTISGTPTASNLPASNPPRSGTSTALVLVSDSEVSASTTFSIIVSPAP